MEVITIALGANEFKQFRKGGSSIEITDSTYPVSINLYTDNGGQTNSLSGVLSGHYLKARFGGFDIRNGAIAQTITILALDPGEDGGSRRQPGNVRVIDQSADKTIAGLQFLGSCTSAASAGQGSLCGIRTTTKGANIRQVIVSSATAGVVQLGYCSGDPTLNPVITTNMGGNKLASGAAPTAKAIRGNSAATTPTTGELPGANIFVGFYVPANTPYTINLPTPIQLPVGYGLVLVSSALNRDVAFAVDYEEF